MRLNIEDTKIKGRLKFAIIISGAALIVGCATTGSSP